MHNLVLKAAPIVKDPTPYAAVFKLNLLSAVGTSILLAAIVTIIFLKMKPAEAVKTFGETLHELRFSILSIGLVLGFAMVANYSGLSSTLALVLVQYGCVVPIFLAILGLVWCVLDRFRYFCKLVVWQPTSKYR
nr:L-lactate permease [Alysiella crassa]